MPLLGTWIGGRQKSSTDYFVSESRISWWVVCLSVVSAETSTLTVLSVPVIAYTATPVQGGIPVLRAILPESCTIGVFTQSVPPWKLRLDFA